MICRDWVFRGAQVCMAWTILSEVMHLSKNNSQNLAFYPRKTHVEKRPGIHCVVKIAWDNDGRNCAMVPFGEMLEGCLSSKIPCEDGTVRFLLMFQDIITRAADEQVLLTLFWLVLSFLADSHSSPREDTPSGSMDSLSSQSPTPAFSSSPPGLLDGNHLVMDSRDLAGWTTNL